MDKETLQVLLDRFDQVDKRFDQMDKRLDKMDERFDVLEYKQERMERKLNDLQLDVKILERDTRRHFQQLDDKVDTVIEVLKINHLVPQ